MTASIITSTKPAYWFIFRDEQMLIDKSHEASQVPQLSMALSSLLHTRQPHYLGLYQNTPCFAARADENTIVPNDMAFENLRASLDLISSEELFLIASQAKEVLSWDETTQFCGRCGKKTQHSEIERAKICSKCEYVVFPQISPVILCLIWRGDEVLLARAPHFREGLFSVIAGFVEPGESLETTVTREVKEEVGVDIKDIRYFASQPWPFPSNLMIGYTAEYVSGNIEIDKVEIAEAAWFNIHKLPDLPPAISLSRRLIDSFIASRR